MKILLTGGAGFIGSNIADAYLHAGHDVCVLDNLSTGKRENLNPSVRFHEIDLRDAPAVENVIRTEKPEVINHQAAQISVRKSVADPAFDAHVNIIGILNILESARKNGVGRFIFASSGGVVYGDSSQIPTAEDYEPKIPVSPYGVTKLACEYYLNFYFHAYNLPYVALRYANVYGPRQNPEGEAGVVAIFTNRLLSGKAPVINGDGLQTRDYVFVKDVVAANLKALSSAFVGAVNVGTSAETDVVSLLKVIENRIGSGLEAEFAPAKQGEQQRSCLDNNRAKKELGWKPEFDLESGIGETVAYFKGRKP